MIRGSCLCGAVRFEVVRVVGPFELCHCSRCRKSSGSAYLAGVGVEGLRFVAGREHIKVFVLPVREEPPGYGRPFCELCGSPVPAPDAQSAWSEIPAGLLDDDPGRRPDRHIFVEHRPAWTPTGDGLPELDRQALLALRARTRATRSGA